MSHITGEVIDLGVPVTIGPDTGVAPDGPNTWSHQFSHTPAPDGTKLLILHFVNVDLPPGNRLEVDLGYGTDVFTNADGMQFWTRPVNIYTVPGGLVPIRYVADGSLTGSVQIDRYGRGQRHIGDQDPTAYSNCDPFLGGPMGPAQYLEPDYDPFWYCTEPPDWQNAACAPNDIRRQVARSVGMMIHAYFDDIVDQTFLSTCTVTLVDADKVITAGHCLNPDEALEVESGSVVFGYETDCAGNRVDPYNPPVYKIASVLNQRWSGGHDYCLVQLATPVAGIPPIQLRHDRPPAGEQVFGIHHPNGAVKKLSLPSPGFTTVLSSAPLAVKVPDGFDVSGGSSGSGLFDLAGRIIGVLSNGDPCDPNFDIPLEYYPMQDFMADTLPAPPPPVERDVMLVFDRSGSMSEDEGTGRQKIEVARDAVSLFVQLVRGGTGNRLGLTSFSSAAGVVTTMTAVNDASKEDLVGPAPYSAGEVGDLVPGGRTSIGGGLQVGQGDLGAGGPNPKAILLLTDGMQNTEPMIDDVEGAITATVHAIGFGTESNLDGELLDQLATSHGGLYMRAGNGLTLEKFFSQAFGNIFENGILFDPEFDLPANESGRYIEFNVCGEETITAVVGWDRTDADLLLELHTPAGQVITSATAGVEDAAGVTWAFLRVRLPFKGERDGTWRVRVVRPRGGGEFPPPTPALRYFLNVIPLGGPRLLRADRGRRYYTGDPINPMVMLRYENGGWPHRADLALTVTRPNQGVGNILTKAGLGSAGSVGGDVLSARFATLRALEAQSGTPLVTYTQSAFAMTSDRRDTGGAFEPSGIHGKALVDHLTVEGNYTLHVKATYGDACKGSRELAWTVGVGVGIDPGKTDVTTTPLDGGPGGQDCLRLTFTPRDRYGNHLGPGRAADFDVLPVAGTTLTSAVVDLGNGSYRVDICSDPDSPEPPGIVVAQPGRDPVTLVPPTDRLYVYSVKFLCGVQADSGCGCEPVQPGNYSTEITIHNFHSREVRVVKRVIPVIVAGAVKGREPSVARVAAADRVALPPHSATMDDCCRLWELLLGAQTTAEVPITSGVLEVTSPVELSVTAVMTASDGKRRSIAVDATTVTARRVGRDDAR